MTQPTRPPAWPGSGRSPGPPILNLWIPVSRSTPPSTPPPPPIPSDASVLAIDRDVEKSPRTPAHATHSYAVNDHAGPSAWLARVARRGGGGAGVVKRFLAAGLLLVVLVVLIAKSTDSISTVRKWTGTNSVGASAHSEAVLSPEPVPPPPPPHPPKPPARPTGDLRPIDIASDAMPLDATTEERLAMWESSPGGRGDVDGEVEMGDFVRWNLEQCEDTWPNHNNDLMRKAANTWGTLNRSSIHDHRSDLINAVRQADLAGELDQVGSGRGIVFTAGNADTVQRVIYTLRVLRHVYNCDLPAQIYHFPSEKLNSDNPQLEELKALGAEMVEAEGTHRDGAKRKSYHLKGLAITQSPFQEVLFLDSDNIPTRDPTYVFDAPAYKRLGAMFFPDYWKTGPTNPIWQIMGVKCRNEWEMEAGQIFIDKARHLDALALTKYMLAHHDTYYMYSDGDKDVFRFAFLALRKRWAVPGRYVGAGGLPGRTASGDHCGLSMQHYDQLGKPLFIHYNLLKQVPSGVHKGFSWGKTKQFPLFLDPAHPTNASSLPGLGDVDCDMLADADDNGNARSPAAWEVRKRAAVERGARPFFHGGIVSALCIDMRFDDPRPDSAREADNHAAFDSGDPNFDVASLNELGIVWSDKFLEVALWQDDPLLKDFENNVYAEGFVPNGKGF